jgi:hypothetical protein
MKCVVLCYQINELYSQAFADENHSGKPSVDNIKHHWEDEMQISSNVLSVEELENEFYSLEGSYASGEGFKFEIPQMRLLKISSDDAPLCFVGASESILEKIEIVNAPEQHIVKIFLKDLEPMANPVPGIYIATKQFPKELSV